MILYVFFGGFTTLVNIAVYLVSTKVFHMDLVLSNILAWILSVLFAYVTNKIFVFESKIWNAKLLLREFFSFVGDVYKRQVLCGAGGVTTRKG